MYASSWCSSALALVLAAAALPLPVAAVPLPAANALPRTPKKGIVLPFKKTQRPRTLAERAAPEGNVVGGSVGLGDSQDL